MSRHENVEGTRRDKEEEKNQKKKGREPHSEMSSLSVPPFGAEGRVMAAVTEAYGGLRAADRLVRRADM